MQAGCLQRAKAFVTRQQRVAPEGDDDRLLAGLQHSRVGLIGTGALVGHSVVPPPLGYDSAIAAVALRQYPPARLTAPPRATG